MYNYEMTIIFSHTLDVSSIEEICRKGSETLKLNGGSMLRAEYWGMRTLAYAIEKQKRAHYAFLSFQTEAKNLHEWENRLRTQDKERVLRFLSIRCDEKPSEDMTSLAVSALNIA